MRTLGNLTIDAAWLVAVTALAAGAGCEREAGPGVGRKSAAVVAAAPTSSTRPSGVVAAEREGAPAPVKEAGGVLVHVTGAELLGAIRASGKQATIVNAWASWCGPCRREVPMLQALAANLKQEGVQIVLVSVDQPKDEAKAQSFLKDNAVTLKSYIVDGDLGAFKAAINPNWPGMLPASFLFDRTASLVHFWGGEAFENELVPIVESFLAGRAIAPETHFGLAPGKVE